VSFLIFSFSQQAADIYNWETIQTEVEPKFRVDCGFIYHPIARILRYFDQIVCEYGLWNLVNNAAYKKNLEDKAIDKSEERILNVDNTHLRVYSMPGEYVKECSSAIVSN